MATAATPEDSPVTPTGVSLLAVEALPSWPSESYPQHWTPPDVVSAQVCELPAARATTGVLSVVAATGTLLLLCDPFPSSKSSLRPQQATEPPSMMAQAWHPPTAIAEITG